MNFKFSLISDMHVDFHQPKTPYDQLEKFVVVAGDTSNGLGGLKFLQKLKNKGHEVFAVDGNHEHYANRSQGRHQKNTDWEFYDELDQAQCLVMGNGLTIIGCNGWYPVEDGELWQSYMPDSRNGLLSAEHVNTLARTQAELIRRNLQEAPGKAIVVTHTAPCLNTLNPRFEGHYSNEWYWNPLMEQILKDYSDKILVWCHGHTHHSNEQEVHGVRVVCNPRGYPGENPDWKPQTIEVEWS